MGAFFGEGLLLGERVPNHPGGSPIIPGGAHRPFRGGFPVVSPPPGWTLRPRTRFSPAAPLHLLGRAYCLATEGERHGAGWGPII